MPTSPIRARIRTLNQPGLPKHTQSSLLVSSSLHNCKTKVHPIFSHLQRPQAFFLACKYHWPRLYLLPRLVSCISGRGYLPSFASMLPKWGHSRLELSNQLCHFPFCRWAEVLFPRKDTCDEPHRLNVPSSLEQSRLSTSFLYVLREVCLFVFLSATSSWVFFSGMRWIILITGKLSLHPEVRWRTELEISNWRWWVSLQLRHF